VNFLANSSFSETGRASVPLLVNGEAYGLADILDLSLNRQNDQGNPAAAK